ncbi:MAG: hypothetical protein EB074_04875 [Actinobacteria bacterium]|nr:hypothetical protein [Actinomycetota bacterium]
MKLSIGAHLSTLVPSPLTEEKIGACYRTWCPHPIESLPDIDYCPHRLNNGPVLQFKPRNEVVRNVKTGATG